MTHPEMGSADTEVDSNQADPAASRRGAVLTGLASAVTLLGVVLAVARPEWLAAPLQAAVQQSGPFAPLA